MASEIKVDTVSEKTSGSGVTIDGLLIKDGGISGDVSLIGTTPTFTIGDAGAEDAALVFDGNAQDFYIALDDSADDLLIGLGSTVGTTPAVSIDENLQVKIVATTASTSATTGSFIAAGGAGVAADLHVGDDVTLISDSAVLGFGADKDTTLTHTDGTGLTLNSTNKLCFNDATQFIQGSSGTVLSIGATDEIDLTATAVDLNGTLDVRGTLTVAGNTSLNGGSFIFNEAGADLDFRVESDDATHMIFVEGSSDRVGINQPSPLGILHVRGGGADFGGSIESTANLFVLDNSGHGGMTIGSGSAHTCTINFGDSEDSDIGSIVYNNSGDTMAFTTNTNERMRILNSGELCVGKTSSDAGVVGGEIRNTGNLVGSVSGNTCLFLNRSSDDGVIVDFKQANSTEGTVSVSGSTVSYNAFAGSHWSRLADNSKPTILRGTVMESIATMCDWYNVKFTKDGIERTEEIGLPDGKSVGDSIKYTFKGVEYDGVLEANDNERLPMCKISDTADSKAVYGVFMDWDSDDDTVNDMYVTSLGAFVVRVHKDETVAIGNWLVSKGDGTAKVLAGNTAITADVQSSLIGKVTSTTKTHTHADDSYCVPCTLHCG